MIHFLLGVAAVPAAVFLVWVVWVLRGAPGGWGP